MKETREATKVKRIEVGKEESQSGLSKVKMVNVNQKIRYSDQVEMDSHLYKLDASDMLRFIGKGRDEGHYPESEPDQFLNMPHAHIFRTIDSDGKKHTRSAPLAGHYHLVELKFDESNPENAPEIVAMSGPMQIAYKKVKGRTVQVDEPLNHYDYHTHDVVYVKSERIHARQTNQKAAEFLSGEANKTPQAPSGVATAGSR